MINENFIYLAIIFNSVAGLSYLVDTIRGKVQPNRVTWFLWALSPLIAFAAEITQGVGLVSLITFLAGFMPLLIFLASFINKKSHWKLTRFDFLCGGLSLIGLFLWYLSKSGDVAILFSIFADLLAGIPTLRKAYNAPETESARAYSLTAVGSGITLLTLTSWTFANYAFPVYLFILDLILFVLIYFKVGKRR